LLAFDVVASPDTALNVLDALIGGILVTTIFDF